MPYREELRKSILGYQKQVKSTQRLRDQFILSDYRGDLTNRREQKIERLLKAERNMNQLLDLIKSTKLTDLERAILDNLLDGSSIVETSKHLGISRSGCNVKFQKIIDKMLSSLPC